MKETPQIGAFRALSSASDIQRLNENGVDQSEQRLREGRRYGTWDQLELIRSASQVQCLISCIHLHASFVSRYAELVVERFLLKAFRERLGRMHAHKERYD